MCTVSWARRPQGYTLWFNRDEQHSRPEAEPPEVREGNGGSRLLAPRDPQGGGTWLATNDAGVSVCLLNFYERSGLLPPGRRSRGELVNAVAETRSPEEAAAFWEAVELGDFAPFHLLYFASTVESEAAEAECWTWDGECLVRRALFAADQPVATSSVRPQEMAAARTATFRRMVGAEGEDEVRRLAFHMQYDPAHGAESVAMDRPDARTVCLTEVVVEPDTVAMRYWRRPSAAAGFVFVDRISLERRR